MTPVWPGPRDFDAYGAPPKRLPPQSESEFVAEVIAARAGAGLLTDPISVRRAIENSQRADYHWPGLYFTPEEAAEVDAEDDELADRAQALLIDAGAEVGGVAWRWLDGRRVVEISVKGGVQEWRELLDRELKSDRLLVTAARYSDRERLALQDRITGDREDLLAHGVKLASWGSGENGVDVEYFAADRKRARELLVERYGPVVNPQWLGPSSLGESPQPFGSWVQDGLELTVFYPLHHNGARPGSCTVEEFKDRIIVTLTIVEPMGFQTLIGGFKPSSATVRLREPVGEREVIDAAHDLPRPQWRGSSTS